MAGVVHRERFTRLSSRSQVLAFSVLAAAMGLGFAAPAHAVPIEYMETATATGTLDGTPFTNAQVTITVTGDTAAAPQIFVGTHRRSVSCQTGTYAVKQIALYSITSSARTRSVGGTVRRAWRSSGR